MSQITTHILDTARGCPADGVTIHLYHREGGAWQDIGGGKTNEDGRLPGLCPEGEVLAAGTYRMHFAIAGYLESSGAEIFYPYVDVVFDITGDGQHYHIPLLLSPFGYSTYRGS